MPSRQSHCRWRPPPEANTRYAQPMQDVKNPKDKNQVTASVTGETFSQTQCCGRRDTRRIDDRFTDRDPVCDLVAHARRLPGQSEALFMRHFSSRCSSCLCWR